MPFSSKLDWGSYITSIGKTASKQIRTLICSLLSTEVVLYHYKSTIWPCMEYCFHVWSGVLVATWNRWIGYISRYAGLWVLHLLLLLNPWIIVFSMGITSVDVHLNWLNWFPFLILDEGLLIILIDWMIFLPPFLDVTRTSLSTVSFIAQLHYGVLCL